MKKPSETHVFSAIYKGPHVTPFITISFPGPILVPGVRVNVKQMQNLELFLLGDWKITKDPSIPIGSMYGIFAYIYHKNQPNVGKYTIHGSYGIQTKCWALSEFQIILHHLLDCCFCWCFFLMDSTMMNYPLREDLLDFFPSIDQANPRERSYCILLLCCLIRFDKERVNVDVLPEWVANKSQSCL